MQTVKKGEVLLSAKGLQKRFGTLDAIYKDLDTLDIKPGVREKLRRTRTRHIFLWIDRV